MKKWTELQKQYVKDIEENLNIVYNRDKSKKSASAFIRKHKKANHEHQVKHGLIKQKNNYPIYVSMSKKEFDFIDSYYAEEAMFSEKYVEGEWKKFVEGMV